MNRSPRLLPDLGFFARGAFRLVCCAGCLLIGLMAPLSCDTEMETQLLPLSGCAEVEEAVREAAVRQMNQRIDEAIDSRLGSGRLPSGGDSVLTTVSTRGGPSIGGFGSPSSDAHVEALPPVASGTNNQVEGVDEADFVKNDGEYIYVASGRSFRIIRARPPAQAEQIAQLAIEGEPKKLFVAGDRAIVYSSLNLGSYDRQLSGLGRYRRTACTYGYNCRFTGDGYPTKLTVLDITDRTAPIVVRELELSGSLIAARRIGTAVHTVVSSPGVGFENLDYSAEVRGEGRPWVLSAYEAKRAKNAETIRQAAIGDRLPSITDTVRDGGAQTSRERLTECPDFYRTSRGDGGAFTTVVSVDITDDRSLAAATIVSPPGAVYASAQALYVAVPRERSLSVESWRGRQAFNHDTTVHRFLFDGERASAAYGGSGVVNGRVLNQFSMDEHEGHLRVATTSGRVSNPDVQSTVTVLRPQGDTLAEVGMVDGLAPGEDIRSVRFSGDRGFVVTFRETDPLFVIDLSDPEDPTVLAELKVPGFSTYMHLMDDEHLLTIGYDGDELEGFAWFDGVRLQIFDIGDPTAPELVHKEIIGTRGSSSEALTNHFAFNYFAPLGLLAVPMTVCEEDSGGSRDTVMTFSGLMVYDVSADRGFDLRGRVSHADSNQTVHCYNWWTDGSSVVQRSIILDDHVFSVSSALIKVNHLDALETDLTSIPID